MSHTVGTRGAATSSSGNTPGESARAATSSSSSPSTSSAAATRLVRGSWSGYCSGSGLAADSREADTCQGVVSALRSTWIVSKLFCSGLRDACSLHRTSFFFNRSRIILWKTGHCFLFNGCMFLGSIFFVDGVIIPAVGWLSHVDFWSGLVPGFSVSSGGHDDVSVSNSHGAQGIAVSQSFPRLLLWLCNVFWFYPAYIISFVINCLWYNDVATHAFNLIHNKEERRGGMEASSRRRSKSGLKRRGSRTGVMKGTGLTSNRTSSSGLERYCSVMVRFGEEVGRVVPWVQQAVFQPKHICGRHVVDSMDHAVQGSSSLVRTTVGEPSQPCHGAKQFCFVWCVLGRRRSGCVLSQQAVFQPRPVCRRYAVGSMDHVVERIGPLVRTGVGDPSQLCHAGVVTGVPNCSVLYGAFWGGGGRVVSRVQQAVSQPKPICRRYVVCSVDHVVKRIDSLVGTGIAEPSSCVMQE